MKTYSNSKGEFLLIEVPEQISIEGYGYNTIHKGSPLHEKSILKTERCYEFHSLPYNEMPVISTGIKVDDYTLLGASDDEKFPYGEIVETTKRFDYDGNEVEAWLNYNKQPYPVGLGVGKNVDWKEYDIKMKEAQTIFSSPKDSFTSLLSSLNIKQRVVILKKK